MYARMDQCRDHKSVVVLSGLNKITYVSHKNHTTRRGKHTDDISSDSVTSSVVQDSNICRSMHVRWRDLAIIGQVFVIVHFIGCKFARGVVRKASLFAGLASNIVTDLCSCIDDIYSARNLRPTQAVNAWSAVQSNPETYMNHNSRLLIISTPGQSGNLSEQSGAFRRRQKMTENRDLNTIAAADSA